MNVVFYFLACSALAMLREQVTEGEFGTSSTLLSQERLICRAAGLSHFLSNEVIVALVSFPHMAGFFPPFNYHESNKCLWAEEYTLLARSVSTQNK